MEQIEQNVIESFRRAKSDIIRLQNEVIELSQTQERIMEFIDELKASGIKLTQIVKETNRKQTAKPRTKTITKTVVKKVAAKRANKTYVGSKKGKKFHVESCPFAKNIKPKSKKRFHSKTKALNEGYKPCKCAV